MKSLIVVVCTGLALGGAGCARTVFGPVSTSAEFPRDDGGVQGVRYYRSATYVLIRPDYTKGKAELVVFTGPDTSVLFAAKPESWLTTNTADLTFDKGVLTDVTTVSDSTKFAVDVIAATSTVLTKAMDAAAAGAVAASARSDLLKPQNSIFLFKVEGANLQPVPLRW